VTCFDVARTGEDIVKRSRGGASTRFTGPPVDAEPLAAGQRLRDVRVDRLGTVLDFACQYSHPKAPPVFSYLVKWDDGQIQAISEGALAPNNGIEPVD